MLKSALLLAGLAGACSHVPAAEPAPRGETRVETRTEVSSVRTEITGSEAAAIQRVVASAPRAAAIRRVLSDTIRLRVGEHAPTRELPLVMVDSAGVELGSLPVYDTRIGPGGIVEMTGAGVRGVKPGLQPVIFTIPQVFRGGRTDPPPSATIYFLVR